MSMCRVAAINIGIPLILITNISSVRVQPLKPRREGVRLNIYHIYQRAPLCTYVALDCNSLADAFLYF